MSETGQPGAATPGEHGDGTGPQDDLARSGNGWAPSAAGWARGGEFPASREPVSPWSQPDPALGWAASSPRHGDLPAPLPGWPVDTPPPARVNGHRTNGFDHTTEDAPAGRQAPVSAPPGPADRQAPVSAPPGFLGEQRRDSGHDRLVVPAQRPAPPVEQPGASHGFAEPESGPVRRADDPTAGRPARWAEPGLPTSAPPAVQVPPVGTSASGFEVPPGLHAPTVDRSAPDEALPPSGTARGWADPFPPEPAAVDPRAPSAVDPRAVPAPAERPVGPDRAFAADAASGDGPGTAERLSGVDRVLAAERPFGADGPADPEPVSGPDRSPASGPDGAPGPDRSPVPVRAEHVERGENDPARQRPATADAAPGVAEPDWSGPNWNRPSWGGGWAPHWSRAESEPTGRRPHEEGEPTGRRPHEQGEPVGHRPQDDSESTGRRSRDEGEPTGRRPHEEGESTGRRSRDEGEPVGRRSREDTAPVGRRSREERAPGWAAEPYRPYEPARVEQSPSPEPVRPYDLARTEPAPRAAYDAVADRPSSGGTDHVVPGPAERPAWAGGRSSATPTSAPPNPYEPAVSEAVASRADNAAERAGRPFRLRPVGDETIPASPDGPRATGSAAATATSGAGRRDSTSPAPMSAPPYAARRSAPDPTPTAEPADDRLPDRASALLPQRVPAEPDVPVVPEPPAVEPPAETPELARIATHLRRDDEPAPLRERPEGFDVNAILDAVRGVAGVRDAALRRTPAGAHSLRLDLADGADPAEVSRQVARLLQERMGLAAAPQNVPGVPAAPVPPVRRRSAEPRGAETRAPGSVGSRGAEPLIAEPRVPASRVAGVRAEAAQARAEAATETPRRRRQSAAGHRGRATVEEPGSVWAAPAGMATGSPATVGTSYSGGQVTTTETAPSRPLDTGGTPGPRVVIDHVQVSTFGLDATVEVRLIAGGESATGYSTGPAVDGYVLRLCAVAAAASVDELLRGAAGGSDRGRCFVEHAAVVPFGNCEVATVVVLLVCDGWVEQLAGSALVAGDPRQAVVRATLAAVNRRLEALLA